MSGDQDAQAQALYAAITRSAEESVRRLASSMLSLKDGEIVTLICYDWLQNGLLIGIQLVPYAEDGPRQSRRLGIHNRADAEAIVRFFDQCQLPVAPAPFTGQRPEFQSYIRRAIIPPEWKGYRDEKLDKLITIDHGAVRHSLARSVQS